MQYFKIPFVQIYPTHTLSDDTNHEIGMSILRTYFPIMDSFRQMQNMDLGNINLCVATFIKPQNFTEANAITADLEIQKYITYIIAFQHFKILSLIYIYIYIYI